MQFVKLHISNTMDIVTRLRFFMDSLEIPSSQFADSCRIPRPTLSQLLNGRNKKISDEIITKVHDAFPELSIMWLMFGEGDMRVVPNIQSSAPQNESPRPSNQAQQTTYQPHSDYATRNIFVENSSSNRKYSPIEHIEAIESTESSPIQEKRDESGLDNTTKPVSADKSKKITSILVFYDDNSFESFSPA